MTEHLRECWDCRAINLHADSVAPEVCCKECGSQDTRILRASITTTTSPLCQKLSPCPFCGGIATAQFHGRGGEHLTVGCNNIDCRGRHPMSAAPKERWMETVYEWNTRDRRELSDAGMSIRRLLRIVRKHEPRASIVGQMEGWLQRKGLQGSVLREEA